MFGKKYLQNLFMSEAADGTEGGGAGGGEPSFEPTPHPETGEVADPKPETPPAPTDAPPAEDGSVSPPAEDASADTAATELNEELYVGDQLVSVEVPEEIQSMLNEKGIDTNALLNELFAKDSDFTLSDEMYSSLTDAFGKGIVDGYLNLYKGQNAMAMKEHAATLAEQDRVTQELNNSFTTLVGGEEGWGKLAEYAETLDEGELASFNSVMALGSEHWVAQKAVIEALQHKMKQANPEMVQELTLLGGDTGDEGRDKGGVESKGFLTREEYQKLMSEEGLYNPSSYRNDPAKKARATRLDQLRAAGIRQGK